MEASLYHVRTTLSEYKKTKLTPVKSSVHSQVNYSTHSLNNPFEFTLNHLQSFNMRTFAVVALFALFAIAMAQEEKKDLQASQSIGLAMGSVWEVWAMEVSDMEVSTEVGFTGAV
ncbi:hypothetical protein Ocin01_05264 [Orchesella cincta]|uniref:Uncharacterized protein n=1 Tax=Orchesella cincta TaxID=48709 RepID=A0A1D2N826_ORCCI|nr:hypothetical protein Ocin01_05264 [Orchesella cincta]